MKRPNVSPIDDFEWKNWHVTRGVGGRVDTLFTPRNTWLDGGKKKNQFEPGIRALQEIVQRGERDHKRVRAVGSGWSLSNIAFTDEYLVNTARLSEFFIGFRTPEMLTQKARAGKARMVFAQCGTQIKVLNAYLEQRRLCLPTSGASNGQTIAGAVSTGTHGSAISVGAMQDYILAVHLVAEGGAHYLIQRKSNPVASSEFAAWLGAKPILDDTLFDAVVVGFGSFGLVHGYLFEAEPLFVLEKRVLQRDYADVVVPMTTLELASLKLERKERPFHFEVDLNPYRLAKKEGGAFVRYMYKRTLDAKEAIPEPQGPPSGVQTTEDLVALAGSVSDAVPELIPSLLQSELEDALGPSKKPIVRTPGQMFSDSMRTNGGTSIEVGVPLDHVGRAVEVILGECQRFPFGAPLALRYVKGSRALLAFTHFSPVSCAMEMPGIDSSRTREAFGRIQRALAERDIPHTYHWGQQLPLNADWVKAGFGSRRDRWLEARRNFLSARGRALFANAVVARCGLAE
jgi:hypothetical protein